MDPVIGRDAEIRRVVQVLSPADEEQPGPDRRAGRRQDGDRRGPGPADRLGRRAREPAGPQGHRPGHGRPRRRHQVPRRVRGAAQGRAQGRHRSPRGGSSCSSTSCTWSSAPARPTGAMDAANLLKPALARGELRCIGATTLDEYREHIEKDPALERRFQPVFVGEPTVEDTIAILRGLKERYEVHHKVKIRDSALVAAAKLAARYITDRFLPDKAIDLVDEACQPAGDGAAVGPDRDRRPPAPAAPAPAGPADARRARTRSTPSSGWPRSRRRSPSSRRSCRTSAASGSWRSRAWATSRRSASGWRRSQVEYDRACDEIRHMQQRGERPDEKQFQELAQLDAERKDLETQIAAGRGRRRRPAARTAEAPAQEGGRRRGDRRGRQPVDRHPGRQDAHDRAREAPEAGGPDPPADGRPGRGRQGRRRRRPPQPGRAAGPEPADRLVPVPGPDRRGQDRAGQGPGRVPLRQRGGDGPPRHERVRRAAQRRPPDRRPAGLRRLRGGGPADRGGPPPALLGRPARRDREGPPRRLQRPAPGPRRRPPDRRPGPHRRLPQHGHHHDLEPRQPGHRRAGRARRRGPDPPAGHGGPQGRVPARVPQPDRRDDHLPPARDGRADQDRRDPAPPARRRS